MKYLFFGTPEFAAIILEKLIKAGMPPVLVICNPDRPVGRKKIITPPPIKTLAGKNKIPVWQPETLVNFQSEILNFKLDKIDFAVVAAYAKILPKEIIELPKLGIVGVHPSLLPKYRGATPIQSVILNGEQETGTTLFLIDERVDHGPILAQSEIQISKSETYKELEKKLAELSGDLTVKILPKYINGKIKHQIQNEAEATYTKKIGTQDAFVDFDKDAPESIARKVRALNPEPGTWTVLNGKRTKILEAEIVAGKLKLKKIQVEGKKPTIL